MSTSACSRASAQQLALGGDAVGQPAVALQRVRPAHALEPADQHLVVGVDEHHPRAGSRARAAPGPRRPGRWRRRGCARRAPSRCAGPRRRPACASSAMSSMQRLRQVVDHVVADVLQRPGDRAAPAAGDPGDDHQVGLAPGPAPPRAIRSASATAGRSVTARPLCAARASPAPWPDRRRSDRRARDWSPDGAGPVTSARSQRPATSSASASGSVGRLVPTRHPFPRLPRRRMRHAGVGGRLGCAAPSAARIASAVRRPMPGHLGDLLDAGRREPLQRAELPQQRLAPDLAQPGHGVQRGRGHPLGPPLPVERDGEPVRLVPHPLQQVEPLRRARQDHRELARPAATPPPAAWPARTPPRRRCRARPAPRAAALTCGCAAVDHDQLRRVGELARPPVVGSIAGRSGRSRRRRARRPRPWPRGSGRTGGAAPRRSRTRRRSAPRDDEPPVLALAGQPVLEDHHAAPPRRCPGSATRRSTRCAAARSASPSASAISSSALLRAVRSPARRSLCCASASPALRATVSSSAFLSPRCGTRSVTRLPRALGQPVGQRVGVGRQLRHQQLAGHVGDLAARPRRRRPGCRSGAPGRRWSGPRSSPPPSRAGRGPGRRARGRPAPPPPAGPRRTRPRRRRCRRRSTTACFSIARRSAARSSRSRAARSNSSSLGRGLASPAPAGADHGVGAAGHEVAEVLDDRAGARRR